MTPFRWKNCFADVQASKHDLTIQSYFDGVIAPAITMLQARIDALGQSKNPGDVFAQADMRDVLQETKLAFGLSVQSIWERQLRAYLRGCGDELRPREDWVTKVAEANWKRLCSIFQDLRGIALSEFPSFPTLDLLQHLGNACRHGDGTSAMELHQRARDLWPPVVPLTTEFQAPLEWPPPVAAMDIPMVRLEGFTAAIAAFWVDAEYIYNESIELKHWSLEERLIKERATRAWLPRTPRPISNMDGSLN